MLKWSRGKMTTKPDQAAAEGQKEQMTEEKEGRGREKGAVKGR